MTKKTEHSLLVFENKVLRKITGPVFDQRSGQWRKRYNKELREITKQEEVTVFIKCQRLRWAGHVARMEDSEYPKRAMEDRGQGKRPLGRPRMR